MNYEKIFAQRVKNIQVSAIKQMPLLAQQYPDAISLGQGIPSLKTPEYIRKEIIKLLETDEAIGKYSLQPGLPELKREVAKKIAKTTKSSVDSEKEIFISAGAMEALLSAITTIVEQGDEVIIFDPSYSSHIEQILFAGGKPIFVPLLEKEGWKLDEKSLQEKINKNTKAIIICSPANPTGKVFSKQELDIVVKLAQKNNLIIIADETYDFLVYEDNFTSLTTYTEIKERLILCSSFSKEFAMTGWRVGYMYAPEEIIKQCLKVHDAAVICAPTISQYAALIALQKQVENKEPSIKDILKNRRQLICERLDQLKDLFDYQKPQGAYYILARYKKISLNSWEFAKKLLAEARVIVIPGSAFGPQSEGCIRMSFGGTEQQINEAFDRIGKWNKSL